MSTVTYFQWLLGDPSPHCGSNYLWLSKHLDVWLESSLWFGVFETKYIWRNVISENTAFILFPYRYWPQRSPRWLKQWKCLFLPSYFLSKRVVTMLSLMLMLNQEKEMKGNHWYSWASGPDTRLHVFPTIRWWRHELSHQSGHFPGKYKLSI